MSKLNHPYDTVLSSGLRFLTELIAWVAGPWVSSLYSSWLIAPTVILLVGLPSVFSTLNDKNKVVVPTPGGIRVMIEFLLYALAAMAPWFVWPDGIAAIATIIVVATVITGAPRTRWLLRGAPKEPEGSS